MSKWRSWKKRLSFGLFSTLSEVFELIRYCPTEFCFADACPQQRLRETCSSKEKTTREILLQRLPLQRPLWKRWVRVCRDWRSSPSRRAHPHRVHLLTKTKLRIRSLTRLGHCLKPATCRNPPSLPSFKHHSFSSFAPSLSQLALHSWVCVLGGGMPVQKSPPLEHTRQQSPGRSSQASESVQVALKLLTKQKHPQVSTGKGTNKSSSLKGMRNENALKFVCLWEIWRV